MRPRSLQLFEKRNGIFLHPEQWIGLFLTALLFLLAFLEQSYEMNFNSLVMIIAIVWFLFVVGLMISNFFRYQKENGNYSGKITFWVNKIQINDQEFELSEISKLNFIQAYDVKDKFINSMLEFRPHLSNGLDNVLSLTLKNGEKIKRNFLQTESEQVQYYDEILIHYYQKGIMEWAHLLGVVNIPEYEQKEILSGNYKNNYGQQRL